MLPHTASIVIPARPSSDLPEVVAGISKFHLTQYAFAASAMQSDLRKVCRQLRGYDCGGFRYH